MLNPIYPQQIQQMQLQRQMLPTQIHQVQLQQMQLQQAMQQAMQQAVILNPQGDHGDSTPLPWLSWTHFASCQIQKSFLPSNEAINLIASTMEHSGSVFDLPPLPDLQDSRCVWLSTHQFKHTIATSLLGEYLERAKVEAWEKLKTRIEKDGERALKSILDGEAIFN